MAKNKLETFDAVRVVQEHLNESPSVRAVIEVLTPKIGSAAQILHGWIRRHQANMGLQPGQTSDERERLKALDRELRKANDILHLAMCVFCPSGVRPPSEVLKAFVDQYRHRLAVESTCRALQIDPSNYREHEARLRNPALRSCRARPD